MAGLIALLALSALATAEPSYWVYPPAAGGVYDYASNEILTLGQDVTLKWWSDTATYNIILYQQPLDTSLNSNPVNIIKSFPNSATGAQSFTWNVNIASASLTDSPIFFLETAYQDSKRIAGSHYFNITQAKTPTVASTTLTSVQATTAITATTATTAATTATISTSTTSATSAAGGAVVVPTTAAGASATGVVTASSSENTTATTVGLGVGLGVGIPLLLIAAGFLALKWYKTRQSATSVPPAYAAQPAWVEAGHQPVYEAYAKEPVHTIHEAPNSFGPYEAPDGKPK